ncbi:ROK family protein [Streptomyces sp. NPDC058691]|uniref:ROK family protein n=1 Tax=Streptomyces sp. NPDC058691 TaxID=3346601 RepID=UPI003653D903
MSVAAVPADVPVLEIGGSHVAAALVDPATRTVRPGTRRAAPLAPHGSAREIVDGVARCAASLPPAGTTWGVALPGPFDYAAGVARYRGVGKFDALDGVDVGAALRHVLGERMAAVTFVNDAHAFLLGEAAAGAAAGHRRAVGITLGTGVGSAFLADGTCVVSGPDVPPQGRADLLTVDGRPLEETVSTRALVRRFAATGEEGDVTGVAGVKSAAGVRDVAERARAGSGQARRVLDEAFEALGLALGLWIVRFGASAVVVGGSVAGAWDLIEAPLLRGLDTAGPGVPRPRTAVHPRDAALIGAAPPGAFPRSAGG